MTNQQNNTNNKTDMKYNPIPFNITIAKRISDGSVLGKISMLNKDGVILGRAFFAYDNPYGYVFTIIPIDIDNEVPYKVCFNEEGKSIGRHDRDGWSLMTEIPTDSYPLQEDDSSQIKEEDTHYHKCKIEPIEYILANKLGFCEGNVVKYITRYKDKGGVDDLRKIKVYVDFLIDDLTK